MDTPPSDTASHPRGSSAWPFVALGLLVAGWGGFVLTLDYAARLEDQWGPAPDVVDALGRCAHIGRRTLLHHSAVLLLDLLAAGSLTVVSRRGWPRVLKVLVAVLLAPSALLHGLAWLVTAFFAC